MRGVAGSFGAQKRAQDNAVSKKQQAQEWG
jgi:hypothetical protein